MIANVKDFGALAERDVINTRAIQSAIDACAASGGGQVVVPCGTFMTGTLVLKSNVNLTIEAGGVLLASPNCGKYTEDTSAVEARPYPYNVVLSGEIEDYGDYPEVEKRHVDVAALPRNRGGCLIYAENAENVSITGMGSIDCNGTAFAELAPAEAKHYKKYRRIHAPTPPRVVFLAGCKNVCIENISLVNSPGGWGYWIHDCDFVTFDKVKIIADPSYPNNDGIHVNCSRYVTVSNANIVCSDDCIVIRANSRSLRENKPCENITVTNCNLNTPAGGVRIGFVNDGVIRNCVVSNCVMMNNHAGILIDFPDKSLIQSDYGREATQIDHISVSNIIMNPVKYPVLINVHESPETMIGSIRRLYFSNIRAECKRLPVIRGRKENRVEEIEFENCIFCCKGDDEHVILEHTNDVTFQHTRFLSAKA